MLLARCVETRNNPRRNGGNVIVNVLISFHSRDAFYALSRLFARPGFRLFCARLAVYYRANRWTKLQADACCPSILLESLSSWHVESDLLREKGAAHRVRLFCNWRSLFEFDKISLLSSVSVTILVSIECRLCINTPGTFLWPTKSRLAPRVRNRIIASFWTTVALVVVLALSFEFEVRETGNWALYV